MPSKLYVYREGLGVVPLEEAPAREYFHSVIGDEMTPTWHPADDKIYTSKRNFRGTTQAHGYTEVGNEKLSDRLRKPQPQPKVSYEMKKALWDKIDKAQRDSKG